MITSEIFRLIETSARLELKAEASKFRLYYLWWVLEPILFVVVFYVVFKILLASPQDEFLLFLMCGKIPFFWFSKSVNEAANSLVMNRSLITQHRVPKYVFPHSVTLGNAYKQIFVFPILIALSILHGHDPGFGLLWLVPLTIVQFLMIQISGLTGALLVSFFQDFRPLIQLATLFLMFGSGVFWSIDAIADESMRELLLNWNPLAFLIHSYRSVLMGDQSIDALQLGILFVIFASLLAGLHLLYARLDTVIVRNVF